MENEETGNGELNSALRKCRRIWTENEENVLLSILEELVLRGYKGENEIFKTSTHEEATKKMRINIHAIDITVKYVISWFSCQVVNFVLFLEVEGNFCLLNCVMAW